MKPFVAVAIVVAALTFAAGGQVMSLVALDKPISVLGWALVLCWPVGSLIVAGWVWGTTHQSWDDKTDHVAGIFMAFSVIVFPAIALVAVVIVACVIVVGACVYFIWQAGKKLALATN